jgi:hypothetical protein
MDDVDTPLSAHYTPPPLTETQGDQLFVPSWSLRADQLLDRVIWPDNSWRKFVSLLSVFQGVVCRRLIFQMSIVYP